jgi:hypothetical protein
MEKHPIRDFCCGRVRRPSGSLDIGAAFEESKSLGLGDGSCPTSIANASRAVVVALSELDQDGDGD